jgi:hypothetical protein
MDTVDLHVNGFKNSESLYYSYSVRADCKQNLLNTFMDERGLIIVIPFIIFVTLLRIELSYILYACQRWKIVLAERRISS